MEIKQVFGRLLIGLIALSFISTIYYFITIQHSKPVNVSVITEATTSQDIQLAGSPTITAQKEHYKNCIVINATTATIMADTINDTFGVNVIYDKLHQYKDKINQQTFYIINTKGASQDATLNALQACGEMGLKDIKLAKTEK
jgi:hypothetical protein